MDRGVLIASGLMAGGAIMGVVDAIINASIKMSTGTMEAKGIVHILSDAAFEGAAGEWLGLAGLAALCAFLVIYARRARPEKAGA
jgi:hypothetical protein